MNKTELWENIKSKYSHLENYCKIEVVGSEDESNYYHIGSWRGRAKGNYDIDWTYKIVEQ